MKTTRTTAGAAAALAVATLAAGTGVVTAGAAPPPPEPPRTTTTTVWHADEVTAVVRFANRSAKLRKKAVRVLDATSAAVPDDARKVRSRVVGWVQLGGSKDLSVRRAKKVKRALVDGGVDGRWTVKGKGVDGPTKQSRKATVRIRFQAPVEVTVDLPPAETVTATATDTVSSTETVTATTTATATETVSSVATVTATTTTTVAVPTTTTATATTTATETVTQTVTASPAPAPVNLVNPTIDVEWGEDYTFHADLGEWEGGEHTPVSFSLVWQGGTFDVFGEDGPICSGFSTLTGWSGSSVTKSWDQVPECLRVVVTATNAGGSTVANGQSWILPV